MSTESAPAGSSRSAATKLAAIFAKSGYVRRFAADERQRLGSSQYKKGFEVRLLFGTQDQLREARRLLEALGLRAGKPYRKHSRLVQPVYGKPALDWFLAQLPAGRARSAIGFTVAGARAVRRSRRADEE